MELTLIFPDPNRKKSYKSALRKYNVYINGKNILTINQDCVLEGTIEVKEGDKIYVEKRFAWSNKDAHFYYKVGEPTAELVNQQEKKKHVYTDAANTNVLFILDDLDFKKAINVAK